MNILLVDDDQGALQILRDALDSADTILTAKSADAVSAAEGAGRLDLLVTNVVMEAVDGFSLSMALEERFAGLKTIFTTEYDLSDYAEHTAGHDVLPKPVDPAALQSAVQRCRPEPAATEEELSGQVLGGFKIRERLGQGNWGPVYLAARTQSNRLVALEMLADRAGEKKFVAEVMAKARVKHPAVLSVYNTEEHGKHFFSVSEYAPGKTVAALAAAGEKIPEKLAVETLRTVAATLATLSQSRAPHAGVSAGDIWIGADKKPRLSNLITSEGTATTAQQEMRALSKIIQPVLQGAPSPAFASILERMAEGGHKGFSSWLILIQAIDGPFKGLAAPPPAVAKEARPAPAVEEEKTGKPWWRWALAILWAVIGVGAAFYLGRFAYGNLFKPKDFDAMVEVSGGAFIYQDNLRLQLPTFWIDKYEVTIGQYAKFLDALDKNPTSKYDSPLQPKEKTSHKPRNWDIYYTAATTTGKAGDVPIDVNCPVFLVDWYDAYAYAHWKGRRLPTEMEWEKAGRGTEGSLYPWGNAPDPKKCNSSADYNDDPKAGGNVDGYNRWCPVNAILADRSIYGVIGLAGNVAEWTDTWDPVAKIPVVRGGTYHSPDYQLTRRSVFLEADQASEYVGFRTATSEPPPK